MTVKQVCMCNARMTGTMALQVDKLDHQSHAVVDRQLHTVRSSLRSCIINWSSVLPTVSGRRRLCSPHVCYVLHHYKPNLRDTL